MIDRSGTGAGVDRKRGHNNRIRPTTEAGVTKPLAGVDPLIDQLASQIQELNDRAEVEYSRVVEDIIRSRSRDVRRIEHTLDGLLDFCGHGPCLQLYRSLCRHYWDIDPIATAAYVGFYRELWDPEMSVCSG